MIAGPADLHLAIRKAEEIEMARNLASGGQAGQKTQKIRIEAKEGSRGDVVGST